MGAGETGAQGSKRSCAHREGIPAGCMQGAVGQVEVWKGCVCIPLHVALSLCANAKAGLLHSIF